MGSLWPPVGSNLGHYRLVEKLDEGGVGAVYKAHEAALDRFVAVKVLSPELAKDVSFVHQFLREARAVAALNHPNIIQIYFIGQHDQYIYFAMELVQGRTLDRLLQSPQRPSERELLSMIRQAAMGLQYAQQHGVIHRDIKPSNLILNELGLVKVADFGLARKVGQGGDPSGSSMSVADSLGTPEYMSPEDAANEAVDHRSDLYSLGATLYHLLAGKPLFTGKSGTEVLMHQIHTPPPSVRRVNPQVSPQTAAIVERCLAKKREARFQTYDQLIKAIDDMLAGRTPVAHLPRAALHTPQTQPTTMKVKPRGPGPMVWVLVLLILGAAGVGIWQIGERTRAAGSGAPAPVVPAPSAPSGQAPVPAVAVPPKPAVPAPVPTPAQPPVPARPLLPSAWTALDLAPSFNRNVISSRAQAGDTGLRPDGTGTLLTHRALRDAGLPGPGLPEDGEVALPNAEPAGKFRLQTDPGADVIFLTGAGGPQPAAVQVRLGGHQRDRYKSLAILHASSSGTGNVTVEVEYADGTGGSGSFRTLDWHRASRTGPDAALRPAVSAVTRQTQAGDPRSGITGDLFASELALDPTRVLRAIKFSVSQAPSDRFSVGIFAVSALPVVLVDEADWTNADDLIPKIDPARDTVSGTWRRDGATLSGGGAAAAQPDRLQLPCDVRGDFELRAVFELKPTAAGVVALVADRGRERFTWLMRTGTNVWYGFEGVHGRGVVAPWRPGCSYVGQGLVPGIRYDCVLKVRGHSTRVVLNGVLVGEWSGEPMRNENPAWALKSPPAIGLGLASTGGVTFSQLAFRSLGPPAGGEEAAAAPDPAAPDDFPEKCLPVARMIAGLQVEGAEIEAQRLRAAAPPALQPKWASLERDIALLVALKKKAANGVSDRAGRAVSWTLRNGQRIDAQLVRADSESITLRKVLPSGFADIQCRWTEVIPASLLPLFASVLDPKDPSDVHAYGLLLLYQASAQMARPEDARRALMTAAERQATLKPEVEERLKWLEAWTSQTAETSAQPAATPTTRTERGTPVTLGPARYNWRCMDLSSACNADIIYTGSRAAADEFQTPGLGWTTAGWLQRNNIIGEFTGIPDDGRLAVTDEGERTVFDFTMPPRRNALLLGPEGGRWPRSIRLEIDQGDNATRFDEIAILHASAGADTPMTVTLDYADGRSDTKRLQVLDWNTATRKVDLSPGQRVAIATRSNRMTNMNRVEMIAESVSTDPTRPLAAVTLAYAGDRPSVIGIFGISAHAPRGREARGEGRESREGRDAR